MYPENLKYAKSHEWVRGEDGKAVVGITDHAQAELQDVVLVDLPAVGAKLEAGKQMAVVESVKAAVDLYAPVSGEVLKVNEKLGEEPETVSTCVTCHTDKDTLKELATKEEVVKSEATTGEG